MKESAENNKALLNNAKQRAQSLLEDYVQNVGSAVGKQYEVKWVDSIEKNPSTTSTINETTAVS